MKLCFNETIDTSNLMNDLELSEKYGYDFIEIRLSFLRDYLKEHSFAELRAWFDAHHIKPFGYNSITELNFATPEQLAPVKEDFMLACEASKELGGKSIVMVPTDSPEARARSEEEIFEDSVRVLREFSDLGAPYGVMLNWEPIGSDNFCVRSIRQAWEIVKAVDRDNVALVVDAFNMYTYNRFEDIEDLREIPAEKIGVFHIDDAMDLPLDQYGTIKHRLYPGEGVARVEELCRLLKDIGYDDVTSVELFGDWMYEGTPEDVIRDGYQKTRALLEKVGFAIA